MAAVAAVLEVTFATSSIFFFSSYSCNSTRVNFLSSLDNNIHDLEYSNILRVCDSSRSSYSYVLSHSNNNCYSGLLGKAKRSHFWYSSSHITISCCQWFCSKWKNMKKMLICGWGLFEEGYEPFEECYLRNFEASTPINKKWGGKNYFCGERTVAKQVLPRSTEIVYFSVGHSNFSEKTTLVRRSALQSRDWSFVLSPIDCRWNRNK